MLDTGLWATAVLLALAMGASGLAPAFAAGFGSGLVRRGSAILLFGLAVCAGALAGGMPVAKTLGTGLLRAPGLVENTPAVFTSLVAAGLALLGASLLRVPQSTSHVTVFSLLATGLMGPGVQWSRVVDLLPAWFGLPLAGFGIVLLVSRRYQSSPPGSPAPTGARAGLLLAGVYVAFAIGTNNVGNAVGPMAVCGAVPLDLGLAVVAPIFGLGALMWGGPLLDKAGRRVATLGKRDAGLVAVVTASLLILASSLGLPQSLVQLNIFAILAVSCAREGFRATGRKGHVRGVILMWGAAPFLAFALSAALAWVTPRVPQGALVALAGVLAMGLFAAHRRLHRPKPAGAGEESAVRERLRHLGYVD